jgi:hypothetical protein
MLNSTSLGPGISHRPFDLINTVRALLVEVLQQLHILYANNNGYEFSESGKPSKSSTAALNRYL